jgi:hypothetical protein
MSACLNCGTKLSCGCQKRTASDGKSVCGTCLAGYEASLKRSGTPATTNPTAPTNVNVFYKKPK